MLDINKEIGSTDEIRRAKDAKEYAEATIEVAKECQVPVLDVWSAFMKQTGWKEEGPLPGSGKE
jgi:isoamyl acetate esterase